MKRRLHTILLFSAALTAVLSPCVEAFSYALSKDGCSTEAICCSKLSAVEKPAPIQASSSCCSKKHNSSNETASHCGKSDDDRHGQCSSLCHCNCCGHVVTAFYAFIPVLQASSPLFRSQPEFHSQYHFDYSDLIWQPPRLG